MNDEHCFTCPKCGGHHFGLIGDVYHCHNADDGGPILGFEEWLKAGRPKQRYCGWKGDLPVVNNMESVDVPPEIQSHVAKILKDKGFPEYQ